MSAPRSVVVLRHGLFGFRRGDVVAALEEQRRQIDELSTTVASLLGDRSRAPYGDAERAASSRLDEISAKLDRLLAESDVPEEAVEPELRRPMYVSELGDLGEVRARRIARRAGV